MRLSYFTTTWLVPANLIAGANVLSALIFKSRYNELDLFEGVNAERGEDTFCYRQPQVASLSWHVLNELLETPEDLARPAWDVEELLDMNAAAEALSQLQVVVDLPNEMPAAPTTILIYRGGSDLLSAYGVTPMEEPA